MGADASKDARARVRSVRFSSVLRLASLRLGLLGGAVRRGTNAPLHISPGLPCSASSVRRSDQSAAKVSDTIFDRQILVTPKRLTSCILVLPLMLVSTLGWAASYYVSPERNDSNAGTSPAEPWRSIAKANAAVTPGDTVHLLDGRYIDDPIRPGKSGTAEAPIRYVAFEGTPTLTSDKVRGLKVAIDLSKRSHIVIEGIHVDGVEPNPRARVQHFVEIFGGSFNTIRSCTF